MPKLSSQVPFMAPMAEGENRIGILRPSLLVLMRPCVDALLSTGVIVAFHLWFPDLALWVYASFPGMVRNIVTSPEHLLTLVFSILLALIYVPLIARGVGLMSSCHVITTQRIATRSGFFSPRIEMVEMADVRDIAVLKPFFLRPFSLGHLVVYTADRTNALIAMKGIRHPTQWQIRLRELSQKERQRLSAEIIRK